ncbi:hypothetical protein HDV00_004242 [Rhizophlyctis rosea]|nr:hypothetical protein HDV00_004242 [Rhizophlyctis rosea]
MTFPAGYFWIAGLAGVTFLMWHTNANVPKKLGLLQYCRTLGAPDVEEFMLSYTWNDTDPSGIQEDVRTLARALAMNRVGVWIDALKLVATDDVGAVTSRMAAQVRHVVIFMTERYLASPACCKEILSALEDDPSKIILHLVQPEARNVEAAAQVLRNKVGAVTSTFEELCHTITEKLEQCTDKDLSWWKKHVAHPPAQAPFTKQPGLRTWNLWGLLGQRIKKKKCPVVLGPYFVNGDFKKTGNRASAFPGQFLLFLFLFVLSLIDCIRLGTWAGQNGLDTVMCWGKCGDTLQFAGWQRPKNVTDPTNGEIVLQYASATQSTLDFLLADLVWYARGICRDVIVDYTATPEANFSMIPVFGDGNVTALTPAFDTVVQNASTLPPKWDVDQDVTRLTRTLSIAHWKEVLKIRSEALGYLREYVTTDRDGTLLQQFFMYLAIVAVFIVACFDIGKLFDNLYKTPESLRLILASKNIRGRVRSNGLLARFLRQTAPPQLGRLDLHIDVLAGTETDPRPLEADNLRLFLDYLKLLNPQAPVTIRVYFITPESRGKVYQAVKDAPQEFLDLCVFVALQPEDGGSCGYVFGKDPAGTFFGGRLILLQSAWGYGLAGEVLSSIGLKVRDALLLATVEEVTRNEDRSFGEDRSEMTSVQVHVAQKHSDRTV